MIETCPICRVHSLENGVCSCCGYEAKEDEACIPEQKTHNT